MTQDTSYPDPAQLRAYADEPMPFHELTTGDLELTPELDLVADVGDVTYRYRATYINVETAPEEWERVSDLSYFEWEHDDAWEFALDVEIAEDFICVTGMCQGDPDDPGQYDAYWILDRVTIKTPREGGISDATERMMAAFADLSRIDQLRWKAANAAIDAGMWAFNRLAPGAVQDAAIEDPE